MGYKIKTLKKKIGGSYFAMLPINYCRELDIENDNEVEIIVNKIVNVHKEMCLLFSKESKQIVLTQKSEKELIGEVAFIDKNTVTISANGKFWVIPYSEINDIKKSENIFLLGETELK